MKNSVLMAVCWSSSFVVWFFVENYQKMPPCNKIWSDTFFLYKCHRTYTCLHVSNGLFLGQSDCKIDVQCISNYENKNIV